MALTRQPPDSVYVSRMIAAGVCASHSGGQESLVLRCFSVRAPCRVASVTGGGDPLISRRRPLNTGSGRTRPATSGIPGCTPVPSRGTPTPHMQQVRKSQTGVMCESRDPKNEPRYGCEHWPGRIFRVENCTPRRRGISPVGRVSCARGTGPSKPNWTVSAGPALSKPTR